MDRETGEAVRGRCAFLFGWWPEAAFKKEHLFDIEKDTLLQRSGASWDGNSLVIPLLSSISNELNATQLSGLYQIANQCPLAGGDVVYWARGLLVAYGEDLSFDDGALCGGNMQSSTLSDNSTKEVKIDEAFTNRADQTSFFEVYPNPAKAILNLNYRYGELADVQLVDLLGRVILTQALTNEQGQVQLRTDSFGSGVYFVVVRDKQDEIIYRERITVMK